MCIRDSRNLAELEEPLPALSEGRFEACKRTLLAEGIVDLMAVSLQTREHNFGVLLFPHAERRMFGSSNLRLLIGLALQIALTLENYIVMHEAHRRTKEYELLTEIGQAMSSHCLLYTSHRVQPATADARIAAAWRLPLQK